MNLHPSPSGEPETSSPAPAGSKKVSPALHEYVMERDRVCFLFRMYGSDHICRDRWGIQHHPYSTGRLTLDHVKREGLMMGRRAPSDAAHLIAMCWAANVAVPSKEVREAERAYLALVEK